MNVRLGEWAMSLLVVAALCVQPSPSHAQRVTVGQGSVQLPTGFVLRELRGTDSHPGRILRADSTLVLHDDIGAMSGAHAHSTHRSANHRIKGF